MVSPSIVLGASIVSSADRDVGEAVGRRRPRIGFAIVQPASFELVAERQLPDLLAGEPVLRFRVEAPGQFRNSRFPQPLEQPLRVGVVLEHEVGLRELTRELAAIGFLQHGIEALSEGGDLVGLPEVTVGRYPQHQAKEVGPEPAVLTRLRVDLLDRCNGFVEAIHREVCEGHQVMAPAVRRRVDTRRRVDIAAPLRRPPVERQRRAHQSRSSRRCSNRARWPSPAPRSPRPISAAERGAPPVSDSRLERGAFRPPARLRPVCAGSRAR